jgi:hypothetical protein
MHPIFPQADESAPDLKRGESTAHTARPPLKPSKGMPKQKSRGGRPAKWNPETAFALGLALQGRFTTPGEAARRAGIGKSTLHRWIRAGQNGDPRFTCLVARLKATAERWPW